MAFDHLLYSRVFLGDQMVRLNNVPYQFHHIVFMLPTYFETQLGQAFPSLLRLILLQNLPIIFVDRLLFFVHLLVVFKPLYRSDVFKINNIGCYLPYIPMAKASCSTASFGQLL